MSLGSVPLKYKVSIDREQCMHCMRCIDNCSYGVFHKEDDRIIIDS
ncbi:MAG: 4Fe-4S binding protein, partial [Halobacteriota archaeon]